jgi:hypothetical protein
MKRKTLNNVKDLLFLAVFIVYLVDIRHWPFGGTLQTVADVLFLVDLVLTVVNYSLKE